VTEKTGRQLLDEIADEFRENARRVDLVLAVASSEKAVVEAAVHWAHCLGCDSHNAKLWAAIENLEKARAALAAFDGKEGKP
jgi:hypothetical protein